MQRTLIKYHRVFARNLVRKTNFSSVSEIETKFNMASIKAKRASLLQLLDEGLQPDNLADVLADAAAVKSGQLTAALVKKFVVVGTTPLQDISLAIQRLEACNSPDSVELYKSLEIRDALQLFLLIKPGRASPALAEAGLESYKTALNTYSDLITEGMLGNNVLCLYSCLPDLNRSLVEEALQIKSALQETGTVIQLNTYESLMIAANKAGCFDVTEDLYQEVSAALLDNKPMARIETQRMDSANRKLQHEECLAIFTSMLSNKIIPDEHMVCNAVEAAIHLGKLETAITALEKWHLQGGVATWPICRSTLRLINAIDNANFGRNLPVDRAPAYVDEDGVVANRVTRAEADRKWKTITRTRSIARAAAAANSGASVSDNAGATADSEVSTAPTDAVPPAAKGEFIVRPTEYVPKPVTVAQLDAKTAAGFPVVNRADRRNFYRNVLLRRVLNRVSQGFDIGRRRHRRESTAPADVIAMCCGHVAVFDEFDALLSAMQRGGGGIDGAMTPQELAMFIAAPIQISGYNGRWRELASLVERMRSYQHHMPADVFAAAASRSVAAMVSCREFKRAQWQLDRHISAILVSEASTHTFARALKNTKEHYFPQVLKSLRTHGTSDLVAARRDALLLAGLESSVFLWEALNTLKAWALCVQGTQQQTDRRDKLPLSDAVCVAIGGAVARSYDPVNLSDMSSQLKRFLADIGDKYAVTREQEVVIRGGVEIADIPSSV